VSCRDIGTAADAAAAHLKTKHLPSDVVVRDLRAASNVTMLSFMSREGAGRDGSTSTYDRAWRDRARLTRPTD
jgi:hypothetical protein